MEHFVIDPMSGEILTNATLDYESVRSYRLTVEASDAGEPQRSRYALQIHAYMQYESVSFLTMYVSCLTVFFFIRV